MVAIVDYGVGNLFSLVSTFRIIGQEAVISSDPDVLIQADRLILPGVGAFEDAANKLASSHLDKTVKEFALSGKPLMGICLGMQLLFDKSYEYGEFEGLGLIPGSIRPIREKIPGDLKIPHIGWNALRMTDLKSPIYKQISDGDFVYFVHSYYAADCDRYVTANAEYGSLLTASVQNNNIYGCQFHPEKSGEVGLKILRSFCELEAVTC